MPPIHRDDRIDDIIESLGRIEGKLESWDKHELPKRVRALEIWRGYLTGVWAVLVAGFAYLFKTHR